MEKAQALLFDQVNRSVEKVTFERTGVYVAPFDIVCVACIDGVFPGDYAAAAKILGVDNPLHVECWTAKKTKNNVYKVWVANKLNYPPGGLKFFDLDAPFKGKCLVMKYEKVPKNKLEMPEIVDRVCKEGTFFKIPNILDCDTEHVKYEWVDAEKMPEKNRHGYTMVDDNMKLKMTEHMYTCAYCGEACSGKKCSKCKKVHYCNASCQKNHWKEHKAICKTP